ncbi:MAG: MarR family transcriptional regulator [Nanoarchaeota archaeon]|nr:MarR family transcriptional regulator [Nanoarchaeota archaeon]MBU4124258.1 MarR family transcriptional regulator [Nanoarchaeota archaeon]
MDTYKLKWTRLQSEIFRLLCIRARQKLNLREISRFLKVSPTAVSNALLKLENNELIKVQKSEKMNLVSVELNRDSEKAINMKRVENLKLIYEFGLCEFLFNEFPGGTIILFGSYSRGEDVYAEANENRSDIDIAIIGVKEKNPDLTKFNKMFERKININFYESWGKIHKNLRNNILGGILLEGGVDI